MINHIIDLPGIGNARTGCAAMLALFALGASRETVLEDYLMTNAVNAQKLSEIRQKAVPYHMGAGLHS